MATATSSAPAQAKMTPQQQNQLARQAVLSSSVDMYQPIQTTTFNPAQLNPLVIAPRNVGFIKKFLITVVATIVNNDTVNALALTDVGLANFFSNVTFTDLNNNQRINCTGQFLSWLNSIKHRRPYASGYLVETDTMGGYGEVYGVLSAPATIAASGTANIRAVFEIPVTYSDDDLRGGIYANVINASMQLSLTVNQNAFTATGVDSTFAMYKGTANAVISTATVTVYQNYLDQLPRDSNGNVVLPNIDLSTVYELKTTSVNGIAANNDFGFQYPNFRDILSTLVIYDHDTTADSGRTAGTDINYWALQSANFTNLWKKYPLDLSQDTRQILNCDLAKGGYYMSSRRKPISSIQYGNMELILNAITATANAQL